MATKKRQKPFVLTYNAKTRTLTADRALRSKIKGRGLVLKVAPTEPWQIRIR